MIELGRRRRRRRRTKVWKSRFLYEKIMDFSMECFEFVYGTLDGCLCFCMGKSNHKPIFDEFRSKRTLLNILVVFGFGLVDCNP